MDGWMDLNRLSYILVCPADFFVTVVTILCTLSSNGMHSRIATVAMVLHTVLARLPKGQASDLHHEGGWMSLQHAIVRT
jgi:hypothetical protein